MYSTQESKSIGCNISKHWTKNDTFTTHAAIHAHAHVHVHAKHVHANTRLIHARYKTNMRIERRISGAKTSLPPPCPLLRCRCCCRLHHQRNPERLPSVPCPCPWPTVASQESWGPVAVATDRCQWERALGLGLGLRVRITGEVTVSALFSPPISGC